MVCMKTFKNKFCYGDFHYKHTINYIKLYTYVRNPEYAVSARYRSLCHLNKKAERQTSVRIVSMNIL